MSKRRTATEVPGPPTSARDAAVQALLDAWRHERFAMRTLRAAHDAGGLARRESGLATEIALGALRHHVTIEHVLRGLARYEPRRTPAAVRAILHAAVFQLVWLDGVPAFAAVDEAVEQARRLASSRAAGMVNAVLRAVTRGIAERRTAWERLNPRHVRVDWERACAFTTAVLPDPEQSEAVHLAAAAGERPGRYAALADRWGIAQAEQIAWVSQAVPPLVLQRNSLRIGPEEFAALVRAQCGAAVEVEADAAYLPPWSHLAALPLFIEGFAFVQDAAARASAQLLGVSPGERVLDVCAAPGGKTVALALDLEDRGEIFAADVDAGRLAQVSENVRRLRLQTVHIALMPRDPAVVQALGVFDAVLVDVPCTNTGVLARRPEARLGNLQGRLAKLVPLQEALFALAARQVRPGGRLVYSTCSLEPEENEQQVARFLERRPEWRMEEEQVSLPSWGEKLSAWRDGAFAARLVRAS